MDDDDAARVAHTAAISDAIALLGEARITHFLRAIRMKSDVLAVELCNEQLDAGETTRQIFLPDPDETLKHGIVVETGEIVLLPDDYYFRSGYELVAERLGPDQFRLAFGYVAGPLAGDGGQWEVSFKADDTVAAAQVMHYWIS